MPRYSLNPPQTIFEARQRLVDVQADIASITAEINRAEVNRYRIDITTGERLSGEQFEVWLARAHGARRYMLREEVLCRRYIFQYERDVKRDEIAEQRDSKTKAVIERIQQMGAEEALSRANKSRKVTYKRWLKLLAMDEQIDEIDPENLLRHAYRLLRRLGKEEQVRYNDADYALINLIEQLPYVKDAIQGGLT